MATWTNDNSTYYINPAYLTFVENSGYGANLIQVSASSSCYISVYDPSNGINYSDADKNYMRWKVTAYNNKFPNNNFHYIYARLEKNGTSALIIYDQVLRGVKGGKVTITTDENGNEVRVEEEIDETKAVYYYILIGEVGPTDGTSIREIKYDTGFLTSDMGRDTSSLNEMWRLDKYSTPNLIEALKDLKSFVVRGFIKLIGGFVFSKGKEGDEKRITDIKRSTDSDEEFLLAEDGSILVDEQGNLVPNPDYVPVSDETLPTTQYVQDKLQGFDDKYIRKDQDDYTPHSLGVGGKTTAEGGIQIGSDFVSGLMGKCANIDEKGQAELHSLFIRTFLEVPELRYNRVTVRMGDEINSVSAGLIESVASNGDSTGTLILKLEDGEFGSLEVDDLVMQIFSDMQNPENNAEETSDDGKGNRTMKGFATVYFEVVSVSGDRNEIITYKLREDARQIHPYAMGSFVQRGNKSNTERQTIIYQGIYPKPYTRYMKGVNQWEFTFEMIGMQLGDLSNLSPFGQNLSGYSAYLNNIYFTGTFFELTEQQKAEISAYSVSLSEYVGSVRVDSEGNIIGGEYRPLNVVSGGENVVTDGQNVVSGDYLLQTLIQAFKGRKELSYTSDAPGEGEFAASINPVGCTAILSNGVVCITGVADFEYSYVDIDVNCEGTDVTWHTSYQIKVIKDGSSALYADIDNEMDSVACDEYGEVLFGLPVACNVSMWYGQKELELSGIELSLPEGVSAEAEIDKNGDYTGKVEVTDISKESVDALQIGITAYTELFGVTESRSLTFTVNKIKQGESALLYKLLPSVDVVKVDNSGVSDAQELYCRVLKVNATGAEELQTLEETGLTMQYRINKNLFADYVYSEPVGISEDTQSVSFRLYQEGTLVDAETVPVVRDGNAIKQVGEFYLASSYGYGEGVTREDGPWGTWIEGTIPELSEEKKYLWNYEAISYTGIEPTYTEPAIIAMWSKDGKGIKDIIEWYQVNNDKDNIPSYPHVDGDKWVSGTAPSMSEEAKYLWNYEEILWTDDSVTYTEPVMIGAKGETGATTPVLSVSHAAIARNSLGIFEPRHITVTSTRGTEREEVWMTMYGLKDNGDLITFENGTAFTSEWTIDLQGYSVSIDRLECKSLVFRSYLNETVDYNAPYLANAGLTFVQDGKEGEHGPMPRNCGKYDGSTPYYYNDEYRDYVWTEYGEVFIRKVRGGSYPDGSEKGSVTGFQPTEDEKNTYWEKTSRMALTAIDTALIDEADIAGFVYKDLLMVSRDFHYVTDSGGEKKLDATLILDGRTGYFKCNDAEVKGLITVENIEYDIQDESDGALVKSAMVVGPGEFTLPSIQEGYTTEIKAFYPTVESRTALPPFKFGHSQGPGGFILFYDSETRWGKYYDEVTLEPNILYTFMSYEDNGVYRWMLTASTGEGAPGSAPIVDSKLDSASTNPVENKVITGEIERIGPVVYNPSQKYWKLDGDLLVTGALTMYANEGTYTPSTIMDAIAVDGTTIMNDGKKLYLNPNLDLGGGGLDDVRVTGSGNAVTSASLSDNVLTLTKGSAFLTQHQTIYNLTLKEGKFSAITFDPNGAASTVNIPTNTSHLTNDSNFITSSYVDGKFVTIAGTENVTGVHDFTNGLKIGGVKVSKSQAGVLYLEGNLVVKGGVTMYGDDSITSSSIMNALLLDPNTLELNSLGQLTVIGGTGGASTWDELEGKPSYLGKTGLNYALSIKNSAGTEQVSYNGGSPKSLTLTKAMVGLGNVENTALSTWAGSTKIVTLGTIVTGTWHGAKIENAYLANSAITVNGKNTSLGGSVDLYIGTTKAQTSSQVQGLTGLGNTTPDTDNAFSLGASSYRWKNIYGRNLYVSNVLLKPLSKSLSTPGWYKVASDVVKETYSNVIVNIRRNYVNSDNETYTFAVTCAYNGKTNVTQISGKANTRLITQVAVYNPASPYNRAIYIYYNGSVANNVYVDCTGDFEAVVPESATLPTSKVTTVDTASSGLATNGDVRVDGIRLYKSQDDVLYIDGNVVVRGGITMYGTNATSAPSIFDNLPVATTSGTKGIATFDASYFTITNGKVSLIADNVGLNESELASYLTANKYLTQVTGDARYITAIGTNGNFLTYTKNGATQNITVPYATNADKLGGYDSNGFMRVNGALTSNVDFDDYFTSGSYNNTTGNGSGNTNTPGTYGLMLVFGDKGGYAAQLHVSSDDLVKVRTRYYRSGNMTWSGWKELVVASAAHTITPSVNNTYNLGSSSYKWRNVYATTFNGSLSGNATTSTKATQDGDGNVISSTYLKLSGGTVTGNVTMNGGSATSSLIIKRSPSVIMFQNSSGTTLGYLGFRGADTPCMYTSGSVVNTLLHGGNYNNYAPTLTGKGASGSWGISVTGNAATATNADKLDGYDSTKFPMLNAVYGSSADLNNADRAGYYNVSLSKNIPSGMYLYGMLETIEVHSAVTDTEKRTLQVYYPHNAGANYNHYGMAMRMRNGATNAANNVWGDWVYFVTKDGNVATATKLKAARTIWGQSFDGSGNITGHLYLVGANASSSTGNTSQILFGTTSSHHLALSSNTNSLIINPTSSTTTGQIVLGVNGKNTYFTSSGNFGIGTSSPTSKLHVAGNILATGGVTMYSDIRKKTKLGDVELTLKQVADAPLIAHYYNSDDKRTTHVGSIAQYWAGLNDWFCKKDSEGFYTMEIQNAALASVISVARELSRFESETDRRIRLLEKENEELKKEIEQLKTA